MGCGISTQSPRNKAGSDRPRSNVPTPRNTINAAIDSRDSIEQHGHQQSDLWFWEADDGKWKPFDASVSDVVEQRLANNPLLDQFRIRIHGKEFVVNLSTREQTNVTTGRRRRIKRVPAQESIATNDVIDCNYVWQWMTDNRTWKDYGGNSSGLLKSEAIESAYGVNRNDIIRFHRERNSYVIDLERMTQVNETTGRERRIRRRQRQETSDVTQPSVHPDTWTNTTDDVEDFAVFPVCETGETAEEYERVAEAFTRTMTSATLTSVSRIQNRSLYERFNLYKTQLERRLGRDQGAWYLFHGTKSQNVDAICKQGFDCRLNGECLYGKGSYFARDASYASSYSNCSTLFMAQVLVGEYTVGQRELTRPPLKPDGNLFDSCVNDLEDRTIFVVYDCAHSYPDYLIVFQKKDDEDSEYDDDIDENRCGTAEYGDAEEQDEFEDQTSDEDETAAVVFWQVESFRQSFEQELIEQTSVVEQGDEIEQDDEIEQGDETGQLDFGQDSTQLNSSWTMNDLKPEITPHSEVISKKMDMRSGGG